MTLRVHVSKYFFSMSRWSRAQYIRIEFTRGFRPDQPRNAGGRGSAGPRLGFGRPERGHSVPTRPPFQIFYIYLFLFFILIIHVYVRPTGR